MQFYRLKELLENLYISYKHKFSSKDPVWILHRFSDEKDIELIGLITAAYAYGSVEQINLFIEKFLKSISFKPHEFIINFSKHKDKKFLKGMYYRFYSEDDLLMLIFALKMALMKYKSLKGLFLNGFDNKHENIICALNKFSHIINNYFPKWKLAGIMRNSYISYMVSNPANGSPCKRMNLFLRWMVRKDDIDPGIWEDVPASKLIIPVDTHIARVSKNLRLVKRKTVDLKFAIELTERLKTFDPVDPVKYDFALCHAEMEKKFKEMGKNQYRIKKGTVSKG